MGTELLNRGAALISQLWTSDNMSDNIGNKDVIELGNVLGGIFSAQDENPIEIPRMVVVGTQSSGKSSLLNGILRMDLLPTGKNMVTRTPLHMELSQSSAHSSVQFGTYVSGVWQNVASHTLSTPQPTAEEVAWVSEQIETQTVRLAGDQMNISQSPIYMRLVSPVCWWPSRRIGELRRERG